MWQSKRKVAVDEEAKANAMEEVDVKSAAASGRSRRKVDKKAAEERLRNIFQNLGTSIETLIDASPLGVTTPCKPWSPSTDKKKAVLSNPISLLIAVSETVDALSPGKFFHSVGEAAEGWMGASSLMLMSLREGLANAVRVEEAMGYPAEDVDAPPVMIEVGVDAVVSGEGGESFVDLGADKFGNSSRTANPAKETVLEAKKIKKRVSHFLTRKALPFLDNLTLRANGIVVTSDDCSVECSLDSLVNDDIEVYSPHATPGSISGDIDDFEDCPSVVTEIAMEDELEDAEEEDTEVVVEATKEKEQDAEEKPQELKAASNCTQALASDDDQEYVMTEEPDSDEEEFVDVGAEFDVSPP